MEGILHALSDPVRVAIFADIVGSDCSQNCSNFLNVSDNADTQINPLPAFQSAPGGRVDPG